jgi:hypothetical protein
METVSISVQAIIRLYAAREGQIRQQMEASSAALRDLYANELAHQQQVWGVDSKATIRELRAALETAN